MDKIIFEITAGEIQENSDRKLSKKEIDKVLVMVENDLVLWSDIEASIKDAIDTL